jgi:hypothetical protein
LAKTSKLTPPLISCKFHNYDLIYLSTNLLCIRSILLLKSKVARMAVFFAIDYALCAAFGTGPFMIYSGI